MIEPTWSLLIPFTSVVTEYDFNAGFVQIINCAKLHVEKIADLPVAVRVIADSVKLEIDVTQTRFSSLTAELLALRELNTVSRRLDRVVSNLA